MFSFGSPNSKSFKKLYVINNNVSTPFHMTVKLLHSKQNSFFLAF